MTLVLAGLALALLAGPAAAGPIFYESAPIPTPRRGAVGGVLANAKGRESLSVVGGSNSEYSDSLLGGVHESYDPAIDQWSTLAPLTIPRSDHAAAPLNGSLYAGGGEVSCVDVRASNICNTTSVEVYSPATDSWSEAPPLLRARRGLAFAADEDNGLLYAVGGMDCQQNCYSTPIEYLTSVEVFSAATGEWAALPPMSIGRRDIGAAVLDGKLWVVGGCGGDNNTPYSECEPHTEVEIYDPATQEWTFGPSLQQPRHGFALGVHDGTLFAVGGSSGVGIDATSAEYSLVEEVEVASAGDSQWFTLTTMPEPRDGLVKGYGLFIGISMFAVTGSNVTGAYTDTNSVLALYCEPNPSKARPGVPLCASP